MNKHLGRPILIILLFSLATIFSFEFGVIDYKCQDKLLLYFFLAVANVAIWFGFWLGIHSKRGNRDITSMTDGREYIYHFYLIIFGISLITFIPSFLIETRMYSLNPSIIIERMQVAFSDSSILYNSIRQSENVSGIWRVVNLFVVITGFARWIYFPLSVFLWEKLERYHKLCFFILIAFYWGSFLITGTTAGTFTVAIVIFIPLLMKNYRKKIVSGNSIIHRNGRRTIISILAALSAIIACIWLFSNNMKSREGTLYYGNGNFDHFPWFFIPDSISPAIYWLTGYVTQGYKNLSYCIGQPFTPTFGTGHSWFIMDNVSSVLHINILDYTYLAKVQQYGIDPYSNWHTVYTWFANDVSFIGVPIVLIVLFCLMGQSWRDYIENNDPFAFVFMTIMSLFVLYLSANNTVFSHADTLFAFYIVLYFWKSRRNKYLYNINYHNQVKRLVKR